MSNMCCLDWHNMWNLFENRLWCNRCNHLSWLRCEGHSFLLMLSLSDSCQSSLDNVHLGLIASQHLRGLSLLFSNLWCCLWEYWLNVLCLDWILGHQSLSVSVGFNCSLNSSFLLVFNIKHIILLCFVLNCLFRLFLNLLFFLLDNSWSRLL